MRTSQKKTTGQEELPEIAALRLLQVILILPSVTHMKWTNLPNSLQIAPNVSIRNALRTQLISSGVSLVIEIRSVISKLFLASKPLYSETEGHSKLQMIQLHG